jgi:hypothetical protein
MATGRLGLVEDINGAGAGCDDGAIGEPNPLAVVLFE